ncbi:F-box protein At1g19070-like [Lolium perenne]|uniref:F-box protein At1g19070-like n=1 Tax=Lolium perenne TaxID=4522 RepID=UPI003A9A351E
MSDMSDDGESMEAAVDGGEDRIGALQDDLLKYLMSFLLSREAVRTCVLAKRWRTLWKSVPALRIDDPESFKGARGLSTFVDDLIRHRDPTPLNVCDINLTRAIGNSGAWNRGSSMLYRVKFRCYEFVLCAAYSI